MTIAKIAAMLRVAVMVKPNDFSSSFNALMVVRLAFRKLGQLFLQLQAHDAVMGAPSEFPGFILIQFRHASMQESWPGIPPLRRPNAIVSVARAAVPAAAPQRG
jgi:hypothetical protein